jgi:hypothetical protein
MENVNKIADYEKDNNWHKLIDSLKTLKEQKDIVNNNEELTKKRKTKCIK